MRKFNVKPSGVAIVFYLILLALWVFALFSEGMDYWYAGLAPWYGLGLFLLIRGTKYRIDSNLLIVRNPMEKKAIPLNSIDSIEKITNPLWKRIVTGFPEFSLRISHNQQQTLLHTNRQDVLQSIIASVNPQV